MRDFYITELAIPICSYNYGEADRIVVLITKNHGKLKCVAKGVRKLKSSKRPALEPFALSKVSLQKSGSLWKVSEAKLEKNLDPIRSNEVAIRELIILGEFLNLTTEEEDNTDELFELISRCLYDHEITVDHMVKCSLYIQLNSLKCAGIMFDLHSCINCRKSIELSKNKQLLSYGPHGMYCIDCQTTVSPTISSSSLKTINLILTSPIENLFSVTLTASMMEEMRRLVSIIVKNSYEKSLKAHKY